MPQQRAEEFDGRITPAISRRLHSRRIALGLSYQALADALGVCWSTLRKWELGECHHCTEPMQPLLADFLRGSYDELLLSRSVPHGKRIHNRSFDASRLRLRRLELLCQIGERHPEALVTIEQALTTTAATVLWRSLGLASEKIPH